MASSTTDGSTTQSTKAGSGSSGHNVRIACVGKPSAGKSTFLNATTNADAKVGNYPFTTIDPNLGIAHSPLPCPCARHGVQCAPRLGRCRDGVRLVPVEMLDVAGLVPGAAEGAGLGNRFLDDLRTAQVLLHVVDASGCTNEKGESTSGYDPLRDVAWLQQEIRDWVLGNLRRKWGSLARRQTANRLSNAKALHLQLAGYSVTLDLLRRVFRAIAASQRALDAELKRLPLAEWTAPHQAAFVEAFLALRFPTVLVLNKADAPSADQNIARIARHYGEDDLVICSARAECTLRRLHDQRYVHYVPGSDSLVTAVAPDPSDEFYVPDDPDTAALRQTLRVPEAAVLKRVENITDLVLFRYGGTGTQRAVQKAIDKIEFVPVFPVSNLKTFAADDKNKGAFRDCFLVRPGSTLQDLSRLCYPGGTKTLVYAEDINSRRLSVDYLITNDDRGMIVRLVHA